MTLSTLDWEGPNAYHEMAVTDGTGDYYFKYAESRPYWVTASMDGFIKAYYQSNLLSGGMGPQREDSLASRNGVNSRLVREAVIRGVVVNAEGRPMGAGVRVMAIMGGSQRLPPQGSLYESGVTDKEGKFTLKGTATWRVLRVR